MKKTLLSGIAALTILGSSTMLPVIQRLEQQKPDIVAYKKSGPTRNRVEMASHFTSAGRYGYVDDEEGILTMGPGVGLDHPQAKEKFEQFEKEYQEQEKNK